MVKQCTMPSLTDDLSEKTMKAKYSPDTDTFQIQFSNAEIAETYYLNENVLVEIDRNGRFVSMTVEHVKRANGCQRILFNLLQSNSKFKHFHA